MYIKLLEALNKLFQFDAALSKGPLTIARMKRFCVSHSSCLPTALGGGALSRIEFLQYFRGYVLRFFSLQMFFRVFRMI